VTVWAGVDPGLSGAIAFIQEEGGLGASVFPMPLTTVDGQDELDAAALTELLESFDPRLVTLERVAGFAGAGSAFKLGQNFGGIIVAALSARFRLERVKPQAWQRVMLPDIHGRAELKTASVAKAKTLFPTVCFKTRGRTVAHDMADALLIAAWGRLTFGGIVP
jgi:Holliday junction resolvasome RuvABC endonuclease subunit